MTEDIGTPALLVVGDVLLAAAEALAGEQAARASLKVHAGEHLAAIFLSGLLGRSPSRFDDSGGPDLVFDAHDRSWFPFASPAAFEIKSLPGAYRKELSVLLRDGASSPKREASFKLRVWTAAEVMRDAHKVILKAESSLVRKTPPQYSRHVFLITHPYDHFAIDVARSLTVSQLMPAEIGYDALDSLWVFWPPQKLVMWSKAAKTWTDVLFVADDAIVPDPDWTLSFMQNVELTYMAEAGITASPYVFEIRFS